MSSYYTEKWMEKILGKECRWQYHFGRVSRLFQINKLLDLLNKLLDHFAAHLH